MPGSPSSSCRPVERPGADVPGTEPVARSRHRWTAGLRAVWVVPRQRYGRPASRAPHCPCPLGYLPGIEGAGSLGGIGEGRAARAFRPPHRLPACGSSGAAPVRAELDESLPWRRGRTVRVQAVRPQHLEGPPGRCSLSGRPWSVACRASLSAPSRSPAISRIRARMIRVVRFTDLNRFYRMLPAGEIVSPSSLAQM